MNILNFVYHLLIYYQIQKLQRKILKREIHNGFCDKERYEGE